MTVLFSVLIAIIGLISGGFLARAAYALPRGAFREILHPRCPSCGRKIPLRFTLPIVGAFLARFRCPHCGEKQSVTVPISEWVFAAICVLLYLVYGFSYLFFVYLLTAVALLLLSLIDLDIKEAPHSLLLVILLLGAMTFVFSFFSFSQTGTVWWEHLVGAFVVSLPLFLLMILTGGIGGGDVKLMFCLGLLLGYKLTLFTFFIGIILAAIVAVVLRLAFGKGSKYALPLVPFLAVGTVISLLCGNRILAFLF